MTKIAARDLPDLIRRPIVTEKATLLMEQNKYTFDVSPEATKTQIKAAIEDLFQVKVTKVNTMNLPRQQKRVGKFIGYKSHYKRAIVTLAAGDEDKIRQVLFPEV